jgi:DNA adenine methylase
MSNLMGWISWKNYLKKEITKRFPEGIKSYIEVFGGAAWVLFCGYSHAEIEIYNDCGSDLVNLFRCIKYQGAEFQKELHSLLDTGKMFEDFKSRYNTEGLTDIQRAARFFMLLKTSYGSKQRNYGCIKKNSDAVIGYLYSISKRLTGVIVEDRDFQELINTYDRPDAFLYLDPPCFGAPKYYQVQFNKEDHERLFRVLKNTKGRFLLSYNDCDYIKRLYRDFNIEEIQGNHNLLNRCQGRDNMYCELLIRNY